MLFVYLALYTSYHRQRNQSQGSLHQLYTEKQEFKIQLTSVVFIIELLSFSIVPIKKERQSL